MSADLRVWEIEARTRYRIAAHSAAEALERLHDLDACTAFGVDTNADIQFIASCSVDEATIVDMTIEDTDDEEVGLRADHRRGCAVCQP